MKTDNTSAEFFIKMEQSKAFLAQGEWRMAQNILYTMPAESSLELRWRDHSLGLIKMRLGEFDQAISVFVDTLKRNGNNLSVLLDLALCYEVTGQFARLEMAMNLAISVFRQNQHRLSPDTYVQAQYALFGSDN